MPSGNFLIENKFEKIITNKGKLSFKCKKGIPSTSTEVCHLFVKENKATKI